jgi:hypothetical protein
LKERERGKEGREGGREGGRGAYLALEIGETRSDSTRTRGL